MVSWMLVITGTGNAFSPVQFQAINSLRPSDTCFSKLTIIGSDNGLLPGRSQAIIFTNAGKSDPYE